MSARGFVRISAQDERVLECHNLNILGLDAHDAPETLNQLLEKIVSSATNRGCNPSSSAALQRAYRSAHGTSTEILLSQRHWISVRMERSGNDILAHHQDRSQYKEERRQKRLATMQGRPRGHTKFTVAKQEPPPAGNQPRRLSLPRVWLSPTSPNPSPRVHSAAANLVQAPFWNTGCPFSPPSAPAPTPPITPSMGAHPNVMSPPRSSVPLTPALSQWQPPASLGPFLLSPQTGHPVLPTSPSQGMPWDRVAPAFAGSSPTRCSSNPTSLLQAALHNRTGRTQPVCETIRSPRSAGRSPHGSPSSRMPGSPCVNNGSPPNRQQPMYALVSSPTGMIFARMSSPSSGGVRTLRKQQLGQRLGSPRG